MSVRSHNERSSDGGSESLVAQVDVRRPRWAMRRWRANHRHQSGWELVDY